MRKDMDFSDEFIARVLRLPRHERLSILSMDGGKSMGLTFIGDDGACVTMQEDVDDIEQILPLVLGEKRALIFVREAPYTGTNESNESSRASPATLYRMGLNAGWASHVVRRYLRDDHVMWDPMPSTWRSVLGLNKKKTPTTSARDMTNANVHRWAEATSGRQFRTRTGRPTLDEANSFAMAHAAIIVIKSIFRDEQEKRSP